MDIKKFIQNKIENILKDKYSINTNVLVIETKYTKDGDLCTNIAMKIASILKKSPIIIAEELKNYFIIYHKEIFTNVKVAKPGFINFYLKDNIIFDVINKILKEKNKFGFCDFQKKVSINVEYVSANPTGKLHIGHARGAIYGDVLANLLEVIGYNVIREYYVNDHGVQVYNLGKSIYTRYKQQKGENIKMFDDGYHGIDIIEIAKEIINTNDEYVKKLNKEELLNFFVNFGIKSELDKIKSDLKNIGVIHNRWSFESDLYKENKVEEIIKNLKKNNNLYEKDNALWVKTSLFGDEKDRVIKKSNGNYTYFASDVAYHLDKIKRLKGDNKKLIDILGADHHGYTNRISAALESLGYKKELFSFKLIQMVRFIKDGKEFKMSKRSGESVTLKELTDKVGVDSIRYFFSMYSCDTQMDFDMDLAVKKSNENPVYYVQYAYARVSSILRKIKDHYNINCDIPSDTIVFDRLCDLKERELCLKLNQYTSAITNSVKNLQPHKFVNYVYDLATCIHSFYNEVRILDSKDDKELFFQRIFLLLATKQIMENSFKIIGIRSLEKM